MKSIMMLLVFFSCSGIITFATFAKIWHPHIDVALSDRLLLPLAQSRPTSLSFRRVHLLLWNRQDSWPHTQKVAWKHFNVLVNLTSVQFYFGTARILTTYWKGLQTLWYPSQSYICSILQALGTRIVFKHSFHVLMRLWAKVWLLWLDFIFCIGTAKTPDYRWVGGKHFGKNILLLGSTFQALGRRSTTPPFPRHQQISQSFLLSSWVHFLQMLGGGNFITTNLPWESADISFEILWYVKNLKYISWP